METVKRFTTWEKLEIKRYLYSNRICIFVEYFGKYDHMVKISSYCTVSGNTLSEEGDSQYLWVMDNSIGNVSSSQNKSPSEFWVWMFHSIIHVSYHILYKFGKESITGPIKLIVHSLSH